MQNLLAMTLLVSVLAGSDDSAMTTKQAAKRSLGAGVPAMRGNVRLSGGLDIEYDYLFNQNAIREFVVVDSSVLALTVSDNLLLFKLPYFELVANRCDTAGAFMLTRDRDGRVCVCFRNGRVARVDLDDLSLVDLVRPGRPIIWAGYNSEGHLWTLHEGEERRLHDHDSGESWKLAKHYMECIVSRGTRHVFLDSRDRLWIGMDAGEFGGNVMMYDVVRKPGGEPFHKYDRAVYGFLETDQREILVYGGVSHLGMNDGFVSLATGDAIEPVERMGRIFRDGEFIETEVTVVTRLLKNPFTDDVFLFSFARLFRQEDKKWVLRHRFDTRYNPGRPDAMGCYPSISHAEFINADKLLVSTVRDGFILLTADGERRYTRRSRIEADLIESFKSTDAGMLLVPRDRYSRKLQQWHQGGLETIDLLPNAWIPHGEDRGHDIKALRQKDNPSRWWSRWYSWQPLFAEGDTLLALAESNASIGMRALILSVSGRLKVLKCWNGEQSFHWDDCFATPNGQIWGTKILDIEKVTGLRQVEVDGPMPEHSWYTDVLNSEGPPWYVSYRSYDEEIKGGRVRVLRIDQKEGEARATSEVILDDEDLRAVCSMADGSLLAVKAACLIRWHNGELSSFEVLGLNVKNLDPQCVMQTPDGAIWIGGDGLFVIQGDRVHDLSTLPPLDGRKVRGLARHAVDGSIWIALMGDGVVRLTVEGLTKGEKAPVEADAAEQSETRKGSE